MKNFTSFSTLVTVFTTAALLTAIHRPGSRTPSSLAPKYELSIQSIKVDPTSRLNLDGVFLRATFGENHVVNLGSNETLKLERGQSKDLNLKYEIDQSLISNDEVDFRLELVKSGSMETVLVRCGTVSKTLSEYNRAYSCTVPGESTPLLSYRIEKKDDTVAVTASR